MIENDLILDGSRTPTVDEISKYINQPARKLWEEFNSFIQESYNASPKIAYSKCSGKPGWNMKYQKSGKSLCTLYPEKECFIALVVVTLEIVPLIEGDTLGFEHEILNTIKNAKPFNGTLWLMLAVENEVLLENVKRLLLIKQPVKKKNVV